MPDQTLAAQDPPVPPPPDAAVVVEDLVKRFGDVEAVRGISFAAAPGEVFGLLGHNGAGKTTTIRILTGRSRPTSGTASVGGHDLVADREAARAELNLVFEDQNLYLRLTGRENLALFAQLYGAPPERVDALLRRVGIEHAAGRKVKTYSTGMKQRLLLARALVNEPRVLFLDEPTRGLDPLSARTLREIVRDLAAAGTAVVITTHDMTEADELCDRVAFLAEGRVVALDTPRELKLSLAARRAGRHARVTLDDRSEHEVPLDDPADRRLTEWQAAGRVLAVHSDEPTLADVFVALAGRGLDDEDGDDGDDPGPDAPSDGARKWWHWLVWPYRPGGRR
ncbi:ABC transporter ATP-binding protein [Patulibacter brassicae]|uniref:ABC transporter ATP-binding protein n=1 Tax=Patulibacter brassicae TaxID=1705717 RepID=A0ABU4VFB5_9ACTN|nr:ABC transporter ATP-binding protein [Patulibacter brassicae]MDX8150521.1 ABC transporter ATP-binding protein [Patulibacter brassicae]